MKKIIIVLMVLIVSACSTTYITVNKTIYIKGNSNTSEQGGSALEGNSLDQKADGKLDVKAK